jgi:hypothetical protein
MRLERLEIAGFKSFSDRSELAFDEGVTAIVGPNGCGKSNVADAITWVLGEQSAKSLRGEKMEDVIFNGSDARKPGGTAEVRLRLSGLAMAPRVAAPDAPVSGVDIESLPEFHAVAAATPHEAGEDNGHASTSPGAGNGNGHNGNGHNGNGHNGSGNGHHGNGNGHPTTSLGAGATLDEIVDAFTRDVEVTRRL